MNPINIAIASDDGYTQHMGCLIASILCHSRDDESFAFYILDGGIQEENKQKLIQLRSLKDFEITFLQPDFDHFKGLPNLCHFSMNTYSRLVLPELVHEECSRMIYLDSDMVVTDSLSELWNTDLEGKTLGVVSDRLEFASPDSPVIQILGLRSRMFNAGMLLMDMARLRQSGKFHDCIQWLLNHVSEVNNADQDGLNKLFEQDKKELSFRWNIQVSEDFDVKLLSCYKSHPEIAKYFLEAKGILHFIGEKKPWQWGYYEKLGAEYWKNLKKTPWKDFRPIKPPLKYRIRLFLRHNKANQQFKQFCKTIKLWMRGEKKK